MALLWLPKCRLQLGDLRACQDRDCGALTAAHLRGLLATTKRNFDTKCRMRLTHARSRRALPRRVLRDVASGDSRAIRHTNDQI